MLKKNKMLRSYLLYPSLTLNAIYLHIYLSIIFIIMCLSIYTTTIISIFYKSVGGSTKSTLTMSPYNSPLSLCIFMGGGNNISSFNILIILYLLFCYTLLFYISSL